MNKIIFTADDFGVIPSVNEGITDLVNQGLINSVEVFTNYHKSVANVKQLLEDTNGANFELGVHLTITSGKPLGNGRGLGAILEDGNFKKFSATNSGASNQAIYREIKAQIDALKSHNDFKDRVTHVTCHHDALWFFPEYTKQLERISKEYNLPVRNPKSFPPKRDKLYYTVILPLLKTFSLSVKDIELLRDTYKLRKRGKFPNANLNYRAPDYMDSRHYGPIPTNSINPHKKAKKILDKKKQLAKMLRKAVHAGGKKEDQLIEFMFHLRKGSISGGNRAFKAEVESTGYEGINPNYFDSRTIEFESLRFHKEQILELIGPHLEWGSWTESKVHTLKKKRVNN